VIRLQFRSKRPAFLVLIFFVVSCECSVLQRKARLIEFLMPASKCLPLMNHLVRRNSHDRRWSIRSLHTMGQLSHATVFGYELCAMKCTMKCFSPQCRSSAMFALFRCSKLMRTKLMKDRRRKGWKYWTGIRVSQFNIRSRGQDCPMGTSLDCSRGRQGDRCWLSKEMADGDEQCCRRL
jgi:hypothetical protein